MVLDPGERQRNSAGSHRTACLVPGTLLPYLGEKESLEEQFARLDKDYPDVVGGNIRYLCSLIAAGIPGAAGSMLLMPTYSNSGSVIELMKQPALVPFLHFQAEGNGEADEVERREIWLNLLESRNTEDLSFIKNTNKWYGFF